MFSLLCPNVAAVLGTLSAGFEKFTGDMRQGIVGCVIALSSGLFQT